MEHWTPHDLRRNVSLLCDHCNVSWDVADLLLAHKPSGIKGIYQKGNLWQQRADALVTWEAC